MLHLFVLPHTSHSTCPKYSIQPIQRTFLIQDPLNGSTSQNDQLSLPPFVFNFRLPFSLKSGHCPFTTAAKYHVAPGSMHLPHIDQSSCFTYLCFLILHSTFALRLQQPKCNLIAAQSGLMDLTIMTSDQANFLHYHPQRPKCGCA